LDIPERGDAASLTEKLDCVTALWPRGGSWGKHGVGGQQGTSVLGSSAQHRPLVSVAPAAQRTATAG